MTTALDIESRSGYADNRGIITFITYRQSRRCGGTGGNGRYGGIGIRNRREGNGLVLLQ